MLRPVTFFTLAILVGTATVGQASSKPKAISKKDAEDFELSLLSRPTRPSTKHQPLYVQPANKTEACKVPTSQNQLDRPNFRAYWDGECKNGYAFGLGRDIAISDTHHLEEITVHNGTGDNWFQPAVTYDFVNGIVVYSSAGGIFPQRTQYIQKIDQSFGGFDVTNTLIVTDSKGNSFRIQTSPFRLQRNFILTQNYETIAFKFYDNTLAPIVNPAAPTLTIEVIDLQNNTVGVGIVRYGNGSVKHLKMADGRLQETFLPETYTNHLRAKYQEIASATSTSSVLIGQAQQIEREYMFKACSGKAGIRGMSAAEYAEICTWRDKFKASYENASINFKKQIDAQKEEAATVTERQRTQDQYAAQLALQNRIIQQQQNQQTWNMFNQSLQQSQQLNQQLWQGIQGWQAPQVAPLTPPGGNKVFCNSIGRITTCR